MVFVAKPFFFHRGRIFGVSTNSDLDLSRYLLSVKLVRLVDYIPIGAVSSLVLYIVVGYVVYRKWAEGVLRRTEVDMKSNLPLRVDQNTTLVD
jgi:hypothetical protein